MLYDWNNQVSDFKSWHRSQCVPWPKYGDLSETNTCQGVMLMDVTSIIFNSILSKKVVKIKENQKNKYQHKQTQQFNVANRFMKFCKIFKYIGTNVCTTFATTTVLKLTLLIPRGEL